MINNIVLDLDETLIHAVDQRLISDVDPRCFSLLKHHLFEGYVIFERPYLAHFLKELCAKYTVSVWTAAHELYADFVVNNIILPYVPKCDLKFIFAAKVCEESNQKYGVGKHLDLLYQVPELKGAFQRNNTALVDNCPSYLPQNNIVIKVEDFILNPDDAFLLTVLNTLEKP